jgi:cytosine/adenosine deaminase-related metal-dependent hydrolase
LDVLADVFQSYGLPAVLTYGATERNDGRSEAIAGLDECARFLTDNDRPLVRGVVGLHASFTVSDETIREAVDLAKRHATVLHLHVAEDGADVDDAKARGYAGVVDRLDALGALIPGSLFAHGVHLERNEVTRVAAAGCWLIQNPRSNRGNGVGYPGHLDASDLVALGTDGYPSVETDEVEALLEEAAIAGDDLDHVRRRPAASKRLFGAFFDDLPNMAEARAQAEIAITTLRERAREQATRLWRRLPK